MSSNGDEEWNARRVGPDPPRKHQVRSRGAAEEGEPDVSSRGSARRRRGHVHAVHQGPGRGRGHRRGRGERPGAAHRLLRGGARERSAAVVGRAVRGAAPVRGRGTRGRGGVRGRPAARACHARHPGRPRPTGPPVERRALGAAGPPARRGAGRPEGLGRALRQCAGPVLHGHQVGVARRARARLRPGDRGRTTPPRLPHRAPHGAGHDRPRRCLRYGLVGVRYRGVRRGGPPPCGARPRHAAPGCPARRGRRNGARQRRPALLQGHAGRTRHR
ncbi:hypothetical protein QF035_009272 [Streptomyces umbrinus]|uniref:Uncharacterized protein n=1 Tax=Streptomyces umbrinus TaxID=67370 RepID=A0ABU0T7A7_9ACTN|nr:hypothetical protein [Streptomyces umbrinus]